ncbi:hypothetical protein BJY04DRAFT_192395 [Aspergillus karnatakaensis]|uniref:uncharacterized protein n=1 Tax=Aspergillus karnatakaensis TaxID=1810916 RepID=UPI003CCDB03C
MLSGVELEKMLRDSFVKYVVQTAMSAGGYFLMFETSHNEQCTALINSATHRLV